MNIFNLFKKQNTEEQEQRNSFGEALFYGTGGGYTQSKAMLLSAVYRCVDVISDSVAQLPLEPYLMNEKGYKTKFTTHPSYYLLNKEPNKFMSRFTFIKTLIVSVLLKGNGYAYIQRNVKGDVESINYLQPDFVTIISNKDGSISYSVVGIKGLVDPKDMIHILNFSYDGITGISTLQHAKNTLGLSTDSEAHAAGFFKGGANAAGILKVQGSLQPKQKNDLKTAWQMSFNAQSGTPNGVAVLEGNMDFQPITVNPSDAQLLETRQFNVIDICRFFGVSPVKAFDLSNSSYSTVEATQLAFLTDTLAPLLEKIELEFERKLYNEDEKKNIDIRFDTSVLLRADKASLANYYNTLFQIGVVSANEIRQVLDLPEIADGDHHFVQVNIQTLEKATKPDTENVGQINV